MKDNEKFVERKNKFGFVGMKMEYTTIDKISENLDGKRKPITSSDRTEGNIPYYGASGIVDYVEDFIFNESLLLVSEDGANLLARSTPIAFSIEGKTWVNNHAHVLRFSNIVQQKYVELYLNHISLEAYITGSAQPKLNQKKLNEIPIPVVPAQEMAAVVATIEKIQNIIHKRNEELVVLDNLIKARFVEVFGERGKVVPLIDYVWFQEGPGVRSVDFTSEGTILLTGSNINDNRISFGYKSDRFISDELAKGKYAHFMCDKDDILVVSSAIAPEKFDKKVITVEEDKKYCLNTGIIRFKPNREVMTLGYFREFLKTDYFKHQVMAEMRGIAQMHFGPSHLKQMTILLPGSLDEQVEFEKFVNQVDKSKVAVQKALDEAQLLFDGLMQKYFG